MDEELRLSLLGGMQILRDGTSITGFISAKVPALLCYLAVTGRPHYRPALAGLLWADQPESAALANLRKALSDLRRHAGPWLEITPHAVCLGRSDGLWLDVQAFEAALADLDAAASAPVEEWRRLEDAIGLYAGDFLEGFYVRNAPAFEEWTLGQRERLRQGVLRAYSALAAHHAANGRLAAAIQYTERLLALDPWHEEAHRQMMLLLLRGGQRSAALAQFEMCRLALGRELGVEPMPETVALYDQIRASGPLHTRELPAQMMPCIGREAEVAAIARLLTDPDCRLLTLTGPAGVGKTRLAMEAAGRVAGGTAHLFRDGACFVPLTGVSSHAQALDVIARSCGCQAFHVEAADPFAHLIGRLGSRELLLVLDGIDQVLASRRPEPGRVEDLPADGAGFLERFLQDASGVKLLVTSRQRLGLPAEWLLEVEGRPAAAPQAPEPGGPPRCSPAAELFLVSARRVRADGAAGPHAACVDRICRAAGGLPLGIELAAEWLRVLTCCELAAELEGDASLLVGGPGSSGQGLPVLWGAFDRSWELLAAGERSALRALSAFPGEFSREQAEQAGVGLASLLALVDKSCLHAFPAGAYEIPPLLRCYARARKRLSV
jgi:DNA-binding SARP family transcriptional activator/predicted ATPase